MEFSEAQIARLILGYLKNKHYTSTFKKFLEECHHFEMTKQRIRSGEHYPTRVGGMSLVEFLEEYANIYTIVQARLEDTDYFNGDERKSSLGIIDQLSYLLNIKTAHASTPISSSSVCTSEVETTAHDALPGNLSDLDKTLAHKTTPKRKFRKTHSRSLNDSINIDPADVSEVLTQHLLDKTEFHIKLANTINVVRNSPEVIYKKKQQQEEEVEEKKEEKQCEDEVGASKELEALIKSVVERTEEDPIYNQLIEEIMGDPTTDSTDSRKRSSFSDSNIDDRYLINKKQSKSLLNSNELNETQNNETDHGIVTVAATQLQEIPLAVSDGNQAITKTTTTVSNAGGLYFYDGGLDCYFKNAVATTTTRTTSMLNQNQIFIGTPGILVVPQISSNQCHNANVQIQQNMKTVLTDMDIMTMPTIIINEEDTTPVASTSVPVVSIENQEMIVEEVSNVSTTITTTLAMSPTTTTLTTAVTTTATKVAPTMTTTTTRKKSQSCKSKSITKKLESTVENISNTIDTRSNIPRHVRNLDFSSPSKLIGITTISPIVVTSTTTANTSSSTTITTTSTNANATNTENNTTTVAKSMTTTIATTTTSTATTIITESATRSTTTVAKPSLSKAWDTDLRMMIYGENSTKIDRSPPRKKPGRKKLKNNKESQHNQSKNIQKDGDGGELKIEEKKQIDKNMEERKTVVADEQNKQQQENKVILLDTPIKDRIPKTPGVNETLTPFSQVIEEQLNGFDIMSFPTPKVPVTPGFGITTPLGTTTNYQQRSTDYSTSSSYYIPSDNEQNKSIEQTIEEEEKSTKDKVNIISDVVIEKQTTTNTNNDTITVTTAESCNLTVEQFNHSVIAKKNLQLIGKLSSSSSSSSSSLSSSSSNSGSDSEIDDKTNNTVVCNKFEKSGVETINDIIKKVEVHKTLLGDDCIENRKKQLLKNLEEKRQRTIQRMQTPIEKKTVRNNNRNKSKNTPQLVSIPSQKAIAKKFEQNQDNQKKTEEESINRPVDDNQTIKSGSVNDDEAKKLVEGLWERGICLVPNKPQLKQSQSNESKSIIESIRKPRIFQRYCCGEMIEIVHQDGFVAKKMNQYDLKRLEKTFEATVFLDDDDDDNDDEGVPVTRTMECIPFVQLLDISPLPHKLRSSKRIINVNKSPAKNIKLFTGDEDKLMDDVTSGKITELSPELRTKTSKKRKLKTLNTESDKCIEKKSRKHENSIKLLRDINVDDFLDKLHNA